MALKYMILELVEENEFLLDEAFMEIGQHLVGSQIELEPPRKAVLQRVKHTNFYLMDANVEHVAQEERLAKAFKRIPISRFRVA